MKFNLNKISALLAATTLMIGVSISAMAGEYDGTWKLKDTHGKPFEVTLNQDGTATGALENMSDQGTWKEDNGAAVIQWKTGWTTRIAKKGSKYLKTAFKPGTSLTDKPTSTSVAIKNK